VTLADGGVDVTTPTYTSLEGKIATLGRAREILSKDGAWTRGTLRTFSKFSNDGHNGYCFCLTGAVMEARFELEDEGVLVRTRDSRAIDTADEISLAEFVERTRKTSVIRFNDNFASSKRDVLDVIDEYLKELEAR
jgi:hypothetical protein